ncbi:hypothetical protein QN397_25970 [Variovorax sp. RTB1]|uniref:hypothetical protein n=1 Tax=Variovorax sp. RTB1 TaxID=3048631 RepID=UPI002B23A5FA|nr:hypothetical protein [Variovorax sp. RTB1]MEB0114727.1 hypothetical protein [Variovorax sp. RTB1]
MVAFAVASPLLHHLWFFAHGERGHLLSVFTIMAFGNFTGTVVVIYTLKPLLAIVPAEPR